MITGDAKKVSVGCSASFVTDDGISGSLGGLRRNISFGMSVKNAGTYLPDKYEVIFIKSGWEAKGVYSVKTPKGTLVAYGDSHGHGNGILNRYLLKPIKVLSMRLDTPILTSI